MNTSESLAVAITRAASKQSFYTIRFLADHDRVADAFRAYGYFRWVDDVVDADESSKPDKLGFIERQQSLLKDCYRGQTPNDLCAEEELLCDLIRRDTEPASGLQMYLRNMMDVMRFDAGRRGQLVAQIELSEYSRKLATAVTEALHYFIGHAEPTPPHPFRYHAVTAAHITHMLRDAYEDAAAGYFNIPREYLQSRGISPQDIASRAYCEWVCARAHLARAYFNAGRSSMAQVRNARCRLAGYAYTARFEWMLRAIERDHYCLRAAYPERKGLKAGLWMGWSTLAAMLESPRPKAMFERG